MLLPCYVAVTTEVYISLLTDPANKPNILHYQNGPTASVPFPPYYSWQLLVRGITEATGL